MNSKQSKIYKYLIAPLQNDNKIIEKEDILKRKLEVEEPEFKKNIKKKSKEEEKLLDKKNKIIEYALQKKKLCRECKQEKSFFEFARGQGNFGLFDTCKACDKIRDVAYRENNKKNPKTPLEKKICNDCGDLLSYKLFSRDRKNLDGLNYKCKSCLNKNLRERRKSKKMGTKKIKKKCYVCDDILSSKSLQIIECIEREICGRCLNIELSMGGQIVFKSKNSAWSTDISHYHSRRRRKTFLDQHRTFEGCSFAGCKIQNPNALSSDHIIRSNKSFDISVNKPIEVIKKELEKCQTLCIYHHRLKTRDESESTSEKNITIQKKIVLDYKLKLEKCEICYLKVDENTICAFDMGNISFILIFKDHINPAIKLKAISQLVHTGCEIDILIEELKKTRMLCSK
jgi:hypothetical protein